MTPVQSYYPGNRDVDMGETVTELDTETEAEADIDPSPATVLHNQRMVRLRAMIPESMPIPSIYRNG